jgi:hypothetical protein
MKESFIFGFGACSMHEREDKCMQNVDRKAVGKYNL